MKLHAILPMILKEHGLGSELTMANIDDVFSVLAGLGVEQVEVTRDEMQYLARWFLANCGDKDKGRILREGKIDKFLGIKVKEI